eukprot:7027925-Prymnesium_polylepis.1
MSPHHVTARPCRPRSTRPAQWTTPTCRRARTARVTVATAASARHPVLPPCERPPADAGARCAHRGDRAGAGARCAHRGDRAGAGACCAHRGD